MFVHLTGKSVCVYLTGESVRVCLTGESVCVYLTGESLCVYLIGECASLSRAISPYAPPIFRLIFCMRVCLRHVREKVSVCVCVRVRACV